MSQGNQNNNSGQEEQNNQGNTQGGTEQGNEQGSGQGSSQTSIYKTDNDVIQQILSMTESGTIKVTGELTEDLLTDIGTALKELYKKNDSIRVDLDLEEGKGLQKIVYTFKDCNNLKSVFLPEGLTEIGKYSFENCINLEQIKIPETVETLGELAFYNCSALKNIELPEKLKTIGRQAFNHCSSLECIDIPDGVTELLAATFSFCSSLKTIKLPANIENCDSFYSKGTSLETIEFKGNIPNINFPVDTIKTIKLYAENISIEIFQKLRKINQVETFVFSSSVKNIQVSTGTNTFESYTSDSYTINYLYSYLKEIIIDNNNQNYFSEDGVLYSKDKKVIIFYPKNKQNNSYSILKETKKLEKFVFLGNIHLKKMIITTGIEIIGICSFMYNEYLETIVIPKTVLLIDDYAFYCSPRLKTIYYTGTEEEWNQIEKGEGWNQCCPSDMKIIFNYTEENND